MQTTGIVSLFQKVASGEMTADEAADEMMRRRPVGLIEAALRRFQKLFDEMHRKIGSGTWRDRAH